MRQLFTLLFTFFLTICAYCTSNEDIQKLVMEAEKQWNAGKPDKSFLSVGNSIESGLGYLKKNKFTESLWYFEEVIQRDANNGYANLFAGLANTGLRKFAEARTNFSKLIGISASLQEGVKALLLKAEQEPASTAVSGGSAEYKQPTNAPNTAAAKPVKADPPKEAAAGEKKKGGNLVYGDYVFTMNYWDVSQRRMVHQQKGVFTLFSNGTYRYMGRTGRYSYNTATGVITWQSGTFRNMGKNTTTFQRNKKTCEIDFEYQTSGGNIYYSGGRNL